MVKRKREAAAEQQSKSPKQAKVNGSASQKDISRANTSKSPETVTLQVIVGSYERALHGFTAIVPISEQAKVEDGEEVKFADTFLFNAHASAIRCLAISPVSSEGSSEKVILATGSTDERINLYHLSTCPPPATSGVSLPSLSKAALSENPKNKELGSLLHHASSVTSLYFPSKSKLLSSSEDNTIAVSRTRDWTVLSTIKAPIPKPVGRPSGDTAAPGEVPAGVNDFAVHPSMKLMVSVGKGERCMRLWNLVTGKKAGVLNFEREILQRVGEGKYSSGEARKVEWDEEGEEFAVAFERGAVIFGLDSKPGAVVVPTPRTKIHQIKYLPGRGSENILALSTEDGRIVFFRTDLPATDQPSKAAAESHKTAEVPACALVGQLGSLGGRIKDFDVIPVKGSTENFFFVTASSDGAVRIWRVDAAEFDQPSSGATPSENGASKDSPEGSTASIKQIGHIAGTYETGHRITCLKSFPMLGKPQENEKEEVSQDEPSSSDSDDSE